MTTTFKRITLRIAIVFSLLLLVACGDKVSWAEIFDAEDDNPFSCGVLDKLCKEKYGKKYDVATVDWDSIDTNIGNIIFVSSHTLYSKNWEIFEKRMKMGYHSIIAYEYIDINLLDDYYYYHYSTNSLLEEIKENKKLEITKIKSAKGQTYNFPSIFCKNRLYPELILKERHLYNYEVLYRVNHNDESGDFDPLIVQFKDSTSSGSIILVGTPLLLTNYNMLYEKNDKIVLSLIDKVINDSKKNKKNITHVYTKRKHQYETAKTIGELLLEELGERLLWLLVITAFTHFVFFYGKRRQRIIPEITPATNRAIGFIEQISSVYHNRGEYSLITKKKITYFYHFIKERLHIDLQDLSQVEINASKMAQFTEISEFKTSIFLKKLNAYHRSKSNDLTREQMIECIDIINTVYRNLKTKKNTSKNS